MSRSLGLRPVAYHFPVVFTEDSRRKRPTRMSRERERESEDATRKGRVVTLAVSVWII